MQHAYLDEYSDHDSLLHRVDARIKTLCLIAFILFVVFTRPTEFVCFGLYATLIFSLILISNIPLQFVLKRSLVIIPFVAMIALFIPFMKKGEVAGAYSFGTLHISVTYDGLVIFWNILIKAYLSILAMILLTASTKFSVLLKALERMKVPALFVVILSFMYRYIFVVQDELMKMHHAKQARTVGGSRWFHARALANMIGVLFMKTYERGENVYLAMCSRGFQGTIKTLDEFQFKTGDYWFLGLLLGILGLIRYIGGLHG